MIGSMMRRAMIGDGSTLNLDFTSGVLDSRLTFTRSSTTATYIDSSGYVASASTDVPRFDHDPTTLAPKGLLIEAQATNLLNWSESFATTGGTNNNWGYTDISDVVGKADPANGTTAVELEALNANATLISSAAIGTSAARTFSVWLRRVSGTGNIQYTQNNGTNWTTQAITSTWARYSFTHTVNHQVGIRIVTSGDKIEIWGAQLETGSGASSYIPTGASQATRNADNCRMTGTNFSSWYSSSGGTWLWKGQKNSSSVASLLNVNTSNGDPRTAIAYTGGINMQVENPSGTFPVNQFIGTGLVNAPMNIAVVFNEDDYAGCLNGGTVYTDTSGAMPTVLNTLQIGAAEGGYQFMNGTIALIKFWPTRLPDATLQSLTT